MSKITALTYAKSLKEALKDSSDTDRILKRFLITVKEKGDFKKIEEILKKFEILNEREEGVVEAIVTLPKEDPETAREMAEKLSLKVGKEVRVREVVDPKVIAGIKVEIEGRIWDNTIKTRLEALRKKLAEA